MAFSDFFSSSRGAGVIGTLIAILVLAGFGSLFVIFDKNMQDHGTTLATLIREQGVAIESRKEDIALGKARIEKGRLLEEQGPAISRLEASLENGKSRLDELGSRIASAEERIAKEQQAWNDYKVAYRDQVWTEAKGSPIEEFKGYKSGKIYPSGKVNKVDHTGISVTTSEGIAKIELEDLPPAIQERYQLDQDLAEAQRTANDTRFSGHVEAVALAELKQMLTDRTAALQGTERSIGELQEKIKRSQNTLANVERQVRSMPGKILAEERKPVSQAPRLKKELEQLKVNAAALAQSHQADKDALKSKREQLPQLRRQIQDITAEIARKEAAADRQQ